MNQPTEAAIKCARSLVDQTAARGQMHESTAFLWAQFIDKITDLPALTAVALAAQGIVDAGRPHSRAAIPGYADGCECSQCETFDTLKGALDALEVKA